MSRFKITINVDGSQASFHDGCELALITKTKTGFTMHDTNINIFNNYLLFSAFVTTPFINMHTTLSTLLIL